MAKSKTCNQFALLDTLDADDEYDLIPQLKHSHHNVGGDTADESPSTSIEDTPQEEQLSVQQHQAPMKPKEMVQQISPIAIPELFALIALYIPDSVTLLNTSLACKQWYKYISGHSFHPEFYSRLWKGLFRNSFGELLGISINKKRSQRKQQQRDARKYGGKQDAILRLVAQQSYNSTNHQELQSNKKNWLELFKQNCKRKAVFKQYFPLAIQQHNADTCAHVYIPMTVLKCKHKNLVFDRYNPAGCGTMMTCNDCTAAMHLSSCISLKNPQAERLIWKASVHKIDEERNTLIELGRTAYSASSQEDEIEEMNAHIDPYYMYKGDDSIRSCGKVCL